MRTLIFRRLRGDGDDASGFRRRNGTDLRRSHVDATAECARPTTVTVAYLAVVVATLASTVLAALGIDGLELCSSVDKAVDIDPTGQAALYSNGYADQAEIAAMAVVVTSS